MTDKYLRKLPNTLQSQAIRLHEYGYYQYAWKYPAIKQVIGACTEQKLAVIGCEFFLPPDEEFGEPRATLDTWHILRQQGESWEAFVLRTADELIAYIDTELVGGPNRPFWSSPYPVEEAEYEDPKPIGLGSPLGIGKASQYTTGLVHRVLRGLHILPQHVIARIVTYYFAFSSEQQMQTASLHLHERSYSVVSFPDDTQRWQLRASSRECLPISWLEEREKKRVLRMVERLGGEYLGSEFTEIHTPPGEE